jgi:L-alanine-DL-glutamate epimerase-like enolase superfamily enzyme
MQIKDVKFYIREGEPSRRQVRYRGTIEKVPPGLSGLFTHALVADRGESIFDEAMFHQDKHFVTYEDEALYPTYTSTLRLVTDGDLDAYADFGRGFHPDDLEWQAKEFKTTIAPLLLGIDALDREYVWQRLWYAQRFFYTGRGVVDQIDQMLWDLASRHARLPVYKLLGGYRDHIPAYRNIHGATIDDLVADAVKAKEEEGFKGCKDHSFRGVQQNIELARELRAAVGDDFLLMHDPVESYTGSEAVKVGRALEKLGYAWMEEPLQDYDFLGLKKLSDTLDLPILGLEWIGSLGGQPYNTAAFLALQVVDIVRQRGVGITGQMKQAQLAESFGVEAHGGNPHVILAVKNDPVFEAGSLIPRPEEAELTCRGTVVVEEGFMSIAWSDRPVEEPDWDEIEKKALAVI